MIGRRIVKGVDDGRPTDPFLPVSFFAQIGQLAVGVGLGQQQIVLEELIVFEDVLDQTESK